MTKKLAAWAAIIAVPTLIAGIYGMNFKNIPGIRFHVRISFVPRADGWHRLLALFLVPRR